MIVGESAFDYAETWRRLLEAIAERGLTVFANVDHAAGAREAGLELDDEAVVIFGNARGGTPLMQSDPRVGLELPLRMLVWVQDGKVLVGYRDPHDLQAGYELAERAANLDALAGVLAAVAAAATTV